MVSLVSKDMKNILCKLFGHVFLFKGDISGPAHCKRCGHKRPAIKWPRPIQ